MQYYRVSSKLPQISRIITKAPYYTTRNMALFPRFYSNVESEFAPMFKLLDDHASHVLANSNRRGGGSWFGPSSLSSSLRDFQPRFDVKETEQAYELHGELPGVEQKNIEVEFTDPQTLRIGGWTEYVREEGERPAALEGGKTQDKIEGGYHKPTVEEDETATTQSGKEKQMAKGSTKEQAKQEEPKAKYWISERATGSFSRQFSFPQPVDSDAVKASLKNGILSVIVPKKSAPTSKRITVE
ncbi:hypothetical protein M433DRAFT_155769 [Acidomyces richmondensis BFW]|nr:MAG: hypothetical protein FE78DRAFT_87865 [Acidomyces sp. 'richmondensis']KYG44291.1 hypothetical protein M433DRAFT_155769 [Acidomyces richmondensis BFW]